LKTFHLSAAFIFASSLLTAGTPAQAGIVEWCSRWMREPSLEETTLLPSLPEFSENAEAFRLVLVKVAAKDLDAPIARFAEWERFAEFETALGRSRSELFEEDEVTLHLLFAQSRLRRMAILDSAPDARTNPAIRVAIEHEAVEGRLAIQKLLPRKSKRMGRRELMRLDTRFWMLLYDREGKRQYDFIPATLIGQRRPLKDVTEDPLRRDPYYRILDEFPRELQPLWLRQD
jgi:hypothetical protein